MTGQLQHSNDGGPVARCIRCGAQAVGPCARCREPVCGDCCVLTEGSARVWAICLACEERGGRSLARAWIRVVSWFVVPILALALLVALLTWVESR